MKIRLVHSLVSALALVLFSLPASPANDVTSLRPRTPLPKPATIVKPDYATDLVVKFRDGLRARPVRGAVRSVTRADLAQVEAVSIRHGLTFEPLIRLPENRIDALLARAAARSGRAQPDLAGMLTVHGRDDVLEQAARDLLALDAVEWVDFSMRSPEPPCTDLPPVTPDYFSANLQDYHATNPGVDMAYAWALGGRGQGIQIADCEYGYILGTEDLCNVMDEPGQTVHPSVRDNGWDDHGTAVLGTMVSVDNLYGVTGLAPDADTLFFTEWSVEEGLRRVTAITNAIASVGAGDVVVLEMQASGATGYGPAELDLAVWTVTEAGTDAGVIVVGAAGNGNQDLDGSAYADYRARGDSGAILVGAGTDNAGHHKLSYSTYGSRVNVQGWGSGVFTLGYGTYAEHGGDLKQRYTAGFSGTSSATPIVAGCVAALQSLAESSLGCRFAPRAMRQLLIDTGRPQGSGGHIGPFPDMQAASDALLTHTDCDYDFCGNNVLEGDEICDGARLGHCPGSCEADCTCSLVYPGEVSNLLVQDVTQASGAISIAYAPSCMAPDNTIVYGPLQNVGSYAYSDRVCNIGASGSFSPFEPGSGSYFFLVVGNDGLDLEGSYGRSSDDQERPEKVFDVGCPMVQNLTYRCDPPTE